MSLISDKIWKVLLEGSSTMGPFGHGFTYSAHPVSAAAALANLDIIEREGLVDRLLGWRQSFSVACERPSPIIRWWAKYEVWGLSARWSWWPIRRRKPLFDLKLGVALRAYRKVLSQGVIVRPILNNLVVSPPFVFTEDEIEELIAALKLAIDGTAAELTAEGVWRAGS